MSAKNYFLDLFNKVIQVYETRSLLKLALWKISNMSNLKEQLSLLLICDHMILT